MRFLFWILSVGFALFVMYKHFGKLCSGIIAMGYMATVFIDDYLHYLKNEST
jgi:hypothetical protein